MGGRASDETNWVSGWDKNMSECELFIFKVGGGASDETNWVCGWDNEWEWLRVIYL